MRKIIRIGGIIAILCIAVICNTLKIKNRSDNVCFVMSSPDNTFSNQLMERMSSLLTKFGLKIQYSYCNNDLNTQINQIQDNIVVGCRYLVVDCVGDCSAYEKIFSIAKKNGVRILAFNSDTAIPNADVQMINSTFSKGICAGEMLNKYLDEAYSDDPEGKIRVLLLARTENSSDVHALAGYQLLTEKFYRIYDYSSLSYTKEKTGETVCYRDGYGRICQVDEPTGGLVLDDEGYAILNPFYNDRIELVLSSGLDIDSGIEGGEEITLHVMQKDDIQIVMSISDDAALGAARQIIRYSGEGLIKEDLSRIAVFGSEDTEVNRKLMKKSTTNESVLRGFVGEFSISNEADTLVRALVNENYSYSRKAGGIFSDQLEDGTIGTITYETNSLPESEILSIDV